MKVIVNIICPHGANKKKGAFYLINPWEVSWYDGAVRTWLMSLMRLLTALQQQGRTQLTSTVIRETRRIMNARYDKTPTAKSLTCLLGQRSDGYNSQRIAPLQADWKLSPRTLHSPHQGIAEREDEEKKKKGQIELEVIKSFPVWSDVSLRLHRCCSSSGCCGRMLLRTHKRDGWPLTGRGKTQASFSGSLWRLGVLGRWWR